MANQADAAHLAFPCNDHPSDKAMFTFRLTAPEGYTAVANGLQADVERADSATTWTYRTHHPMATELAQVSIGRSTVLHRTGPRGLPVRDVVPTEHREQLEPWLAKTPDQIAWMEGKVGQYPFETYGVLMADASTGFELETQTLSLFERELFTDTAFPAWYVDSIMVHELAHQWFGDSVTPRSWSDLWLNEGHATWYEALYAEEKADRPLEDRMKEAYGASARRPQGAPVRQPPRHLPPQRLRRCRPGPLRPAPGDRPPRLRRAGARVGEPPQGRRRRHGRLRTARLGDLRTRPRRILRGLALRREDAADAGSPGLEAGGARGEGRAITR
jgi:hypothetical protein